MHASNLRTIVVRGPFPAILYEASCESCKMLLSVSSKVFSSPYPDILTCICNELCWGLRLNEKMIRAGPSVVRPSSYPSRKSEYPDLKRFHDYVCLIIFDCLSQFLLTHPPPQNQYILSSTMDAVKSEELPLFFFYEKQFLFRSFVYFYALKSEQIGPKF